MKSCDCTKIFYLKDAVEVCTDNSIELPFVAATDGVYTLKTSFLNVGIEIKNKIFQGEKMAFPSNGLNEDQDYLSQVFNEAGNLVSFTDTSGNIYNCISFETKIIVRL